MALMFQRLAHNFVKNGYFPTDSETLSRILQALAPADTPVRILDPCCGEGVAIAEVKQHLGESAMAYGVEYDAERARHAKTLVDTCLQADIQDVFISPRQFGLLFLNPPYGDLVTDQHQASTRSKHWKGRKRLEKLFYQLTYGLLQYGGVLVLIVPYTVIDRDFCNWLPKHFTNLSIWLAPEQQFKQVVIFGQRIRKQPSRKLVSLYASMLTAVSQGELPEELPVNWRTEPLVVPEADKPGKFMKLTIDAQTLGEVISREHGLWQDLDLVRTSYQQSRRPLCDLSDWHLALSLAAGNISGVVRSNDGSRTLVVKGDTFKQKRVQTETTVDADENVVETRISTDVFVPSIRALDFTEGSDRFGQCLVIR